MHYPKNVVFLLLLLLLFLFFSTAAVDFTYISVLQTICLFHFFFFNGTGIFSVDSNTYVSPQKLAARAARRAVNTSQSGCRGATSAPWRRTQLSPVDGLPESLDEPGLPHGGVVVNAGQALQDARQCDVLVDHQRN